MSSDFGPTVNAGDVSEGLEVEIANGSKRFRLYKRRVNGVMQLVKEPREEFRQDLITIESLKKEFLIGYGLNHAGLPRYYSLEGNRLFLEFIEGETLRNFIDRHKGTYADRGIIITILIQLLEVVCYLHEHGILHLDIKPENVMLTSMGTPRVKLIDLGASKSSSHTDTPGFTARYMAPEQKDGDVNFYTDIYQIGMMAKELAPLMRKSKALDGFIRKSTFESPDKRFGSSREALESLMKLKARNSGTKKLGIWLIYGAVLIAGVGYWLYIRETQPERESKDRKEQQNVASLTESNERVDTVPVHEAQKEPISPHTEEPPSTDRPVSKPSTLPAIIPAKEKEDAVKKTQEAPNMEIEREDIDAYVSSVYEKHLSPFSSVSLWDKDGKLIPEALTAFREASKKALAECMDHCKEISETSLQDYETMEYLFIESIERIAPTYNNRFYNQK